MVSDPRVARVRRRVLAALDSEGLIERPRSWLPTAALGAGAAALGAAAALALVTPPTRPTTDLGGQDYLLALYSGPAYRADRSEGRGRAMEYARWAARPWPGRAVVTGGEELGEGTALGAPLNAKPPLAGYFLVRARDGKEALALAKTMPHLGHGGTVVVHEIVR